MKKKMLCGLLALLIMLPAPLLRAEGDGGKMVKVILKDGTISSGELLGVDGGVLMLQTKSGKSKEIPIDKIKKVFDSDGNAVSLGGGAPAAKAEPAEESAREKPQADEEEEQPAPRRSRRAAKAQAPRRSNGAQVAGTILDIVGGLGFLGGLYFDLDGQNAMDTATSKYCPATVCTDGYYPYTIPGQKGYYTASQYTAYYYGESERNNGIVVMCVGGALLITGLIVGAVGSSHASQASLMNINGSKVAWDVPAFNYDPATQKSKVSLLTAQF